MTIGDLGYERDYVDVQITPTNNADYRTKVRWTADTGAPKTMLAEKHFGWILAKNSDVRIRKTNVKFWPYSTGKVVPLIGCCEAVLTNEEGKTHKTTVYIVEGEQESLLGKEDAQKLGIIKMNRRGDKPHGTDTLGCITPETLKDPISEGPVSGGQTQAQIDAAMEELATKHADVFHGMGRAKTDPIHIEIRDDAVPIAQGRRQIPHQLKEAAQQKLKYLLDNDLIEGPLPAEECKGWIHNMPSLSCISCQIFPYGPLLVLLLFLATLFSSRMLASSGSFAVSSLMSLSVMAGMLWLRMRLTHTSLSVSSVSIPISSISSLVILAGSGSGCLEA